MSKSRIIENRNIIHTVEIPVKSEEDYESFEDYEEKVYRETIYDIKNTVFKNPQKQE